VVDVALDLAVQAGRECAEMMVTEGAQEGLVELCAGRRTLEGSDHPLAVGGELGRVLHSVPVAQEALGPHDFFSLRAVGLARHGAYLIIARLGHGGAVARCRRRPFARIADRRIALRVRAGCQLGHPQCRVMVVDDEEEIVLLERRSRAAARAVRGRRARDRHERQTRECTCGQGTATRYRRCSAREIQISAFHLSLQYGCDARFRPQSLPASM